MQNAILKESSATCMLVEVIATASHDKEWVYNLDKQRVSNKNIRRVSIDRFYSLVTGDKTAFQRLCEELPKVIDDVITTIKKKDSVNTVFAELEKISPNLLKSLYLLAFKKYQGFENFNL